MTNYKKQKRALRRQMKKDRGKKLVKRSIGIALIACAAIFVLYCTGISFYTSYETLISDETDNCHAEQIIENPETGKYEIAAFTNSHKKSGDFLTVRYGVSCAQQNASAAEYKKYANSLSVAVVIIGFLGEYAVLAFIVICAFGLLVAIGIAIYNLVIDWINNGKPRHEYQE